MTDITLKVFSNADDVHLVWTHKDDIPGCLGFAIQCRRGDAEPKYLSNRVGFEHRDPLEYLSRDAAWQGRRNSGETRRMLNFWLPHA